MTNFLPPELIKTTGLLTQEEILISKSAAAAELNRISTLNTGTIASSSFSGKDSGSNDEVYARIEAGIETNTDGAEDGSLTFTTVQAGALTQAAKLAEGLVLGAATGGDQGLGTLNATAIYINGAALPASPGDVSGPGSSTDNAVARFDSTTGKIIQGSSVIIDDSNNVTGVNDLTVTGDLTVNGTTTTVDTTNLAVEDSLIQLARLNNGTDALDIGMVGLYDTSGSQDLYCGLFRDATDDKFHLFKGSQEDLSASNVVNKAATGYTVATLVANLEGNVTGQVSDISNFDSDDLTEGSTNLFMTGAEQTKLAGIATGAEVNRVPTDDLLVDGVGFTAGVSTTITISAAVPSDNEAYLDIEFNGLGQRPTTDFSVSGTTVTFTSAIPSGVTHIRAKTL